MNVVVIKNEYGNCWKAFDINEDVPNGEHLKMTRGPVTYNSIKSAEKAIKSAKTNAKWHYIDFYSDGHWDDCVECFGICKADKMKARAKKAYKTSMDYLSKCCVVETEIG